MPSFFPSLFQKNASCPTSHQLLDYCHARNDLSEFIEIESHLAICDFCGAELQLLACYHGEAEEPSIVEIPAALRRLAEDLLQQTIPQFPGFIEFALNRQVSH